MNLFHRKGIKASISSIITLSIIFAIALAFPQGSYAESILSTKLNLFKNTNRSLDSMPDHNGWASVTIPTGIQNMVSDGNNLYVITRNGQLLRLDKQNLQVLNSWNVGSYLTDIQYENHNIYVSMRDTAQVAVLNTYNDSLSYVPIRSGTEKLAVADGKIYYNDSGIRNNGLTVYDTVYGTNTVIYNSDTTGTSSINYYEKVIPSVDNHRLFVRLTDNSSKTLVLNSTDYSTLQVFPNFNLPYLFKENGYMYINGGKYNETDLSFVSTFPANIYPHNIVNDLIFTYQSIYAPDYTKILDLPKVVSIATGTSNGSIYAYTGTTDYVNGVQDGTIYGFQSKVDMVNFFERSLLPGDGFLIDDDQNIGKLHISLKFAAAKFDDQIRDYTMYYLDRNGNRSGEPLGVFDNRYKENGILSTLINNEKNLDASGSIGIFSTRLIGDSTVELGPIKYTIWDFPQYVVQNATFNDMDSSPNTVKGSISWDAAADETSIRSYRIYFAKKNGLLGEAIGEVSSGKYHYSYLINDPIVIPNDATALAVVPVSNLHQEAPQYMAAPIYKRMSRAPLSENIVISNNIGSTADEVKVNNLSAGDEIRIYNYNGSFFQSVSVPAGTSSIKTNVSMNPGGGELTITITTPNKVESLYTLKDYPMESQQNDDNTGNGGGAGIGGGGGNGGIGGGESGGSVLPTPAPTLIPAPTPIKTPPTKDETLFTPDKDDLLNQLNDSLSNQIIVDTTTRKFSDMVKVEIPGDVINKANEMKKGIVIKTSDMQILIQPGLVDIKDSDSIVRLVASASNSLSSTSGMSLGMKQVSTVYDFTLLIDDIPLSTFGEPIQVTFKYDQSFVQDINKLGVFYFDEKAKAWTYVGGKLNEEGTISVALTHFSSYAVMEYNKSFKDIVDHWARTEIERLASKQIISGVTDESFEPDLPVTRAQFTTLVSKALSLESKPHNQVFQDVDDSAWYGNAVYAAYQAGIVSGIDLNHFAPNDRITREQLSVMVMNAYQYASGKQLSDFIVKKETKYIDESTISDWAREQVRLSSDLGLLTGTGSGMISPKQTASRAQASVVLQRLLQLISTY